MTPLDQFDPHRFNVDLHCHSTCSDGTLSPTAIVERAAHNGVDWLALTDHDDVSGLTEATGRAAELGLGFIPGVEISVTWAGHTIHVVGARIDPSHSALNAGLQATRAGRRDRAEEISTQLAKAGIPDALEGAMRYVSNPDLVARSHFARHIVDIGRCDDVREVFGSYLVEGKPGYVPHRWSRLRDAIDWIRAAGGTAIVAHPARYRFTDLERDAFMSEFVEAGGEAVEVVTSAHTADETRRYLALTRQYGLRASRGSDFHDPLESRVDLGGLPPLPDAIEPVWSAWGIG
ncbi:PHP domain-containing protein [soil metagenome]